MNLIASRGYIEGNDFAKEIDAEKCDSQASYIMYVLLDAI
jgi:hypothetical protein